MEDLTKQQIVLVTLLVSFVTSIATGIVTVSLIDQAPKGVTQTINRVVERTIEKVVPATTQSAAVVTKETVVVKEDDFVVESVEKSSKSLVRVRKISGEGENRKESFVGIGMVISKDGLIAGPLSEDSADLDENGNLVASRFEVSLPGGKNIGVSMIGKDKESGLAIYRADPSRDKTAKDAPSFAPAVFGHPENLKLGQTVISLDGEETNSVSVGIVGSLVLEKPSSPDQKATSTPSANSKEEAPSVSSIRTSVKGELVSGAILINLYGEVVGMKTARDFEISGAFSPWSAVSSVISRITGGKK